MKMKRKDGFDRTAQNPQIKKENRNKGGRNPTAQIQQMIIKDPSLRLRSDGAD
jgi:hypothetical protein